MFKKLKILNCFLAALLLIGPGYSLADEVRYEYDWNFPEGAFSKANIRANIRGLHQMDFMPLRPSAKRVIDGMEYGTDAAAQAIYAGTGVTITSDSANEQEGSYSLKAVTDGTANREFEASYTLNLSSFLSITLWERSSQTSDTFQFFLEDSGGNQSYWDITSNGTADTWQQDTITLASPDSNSGTPADLSDIVIIGYRGLTASTTYYFDTVKAIVGMTVSVSGTNLGNYYRHVHPANQPLSVDSQAAPTLTAPTTNPRIDILTIDSSGTLAWVTGTEASSPSAPWSSVANNQIPICLVYLKTTMTKVLDYVDKDTDSNQGYIYADVRPFLKPGSGYAKGADVASGSSIVLGNDGNFFDITGTTNIQTITAKSAGTVVWLQFDGALTVDDGGGNLSLNGDFITAAGSVLTLVSNGTTWYEVSRQPTAGDFISLEDTPIGYTGHGLKVVRVNSGETGIEFNSMSFTDLDDVDTSYSGDGGKFLKVNSGETAIEYVSAETSMTSLVDSWHGAEAATYFTSTSSATDTAGTPVYSGHRKLGTGYLTIGRFQFTKKSGADTLRIYARMASSSVSYSNVIRLTVNGALTVSINTTSTTLTWINDTLDVSSLSDGTIYEGVIEMTNVNASGYSFCTAYQILAEQ